MTDVAVREDVLEDFDKWVKRRGALGVGSLPVRIFIAGWLAGQRRASNQTAEQRDRREDREQAAYDALYDEIEARIIAEEIADGADEDYKPSGARVHALVEKQLKKRKER